MGSVLVVEDDAAIGARLHAALQANGHQASWHRTGSSALIEADLQAFELALLDLNLPDGDGVDVCRALKLRHPACVVVMLTARREEMDVIVGLESGADDYLMKPFRMTELLARVRAHLRRQTPPAGTGAPLELNDLMVDIAARRCAVKDVELALRPKEFDLLARLVTTVNVAVTREQLIADVWDANWFGSTKTLDVHVAALRHRLDEAADWFEPPARLPTITTLRGHGYRLDAV